MANKELTTGEVAGRLGVGVSTVRLWCQQGLIPGAYQQETGRGPVWLIPAGGLTGFKPPDRGRPKKEKKGGRK